MHALGQDRWLISPKADLILGCGGLVWLLFLIDFFVVLPHNDPFLVPAVATAVVLGMHSLGETHIIASIREAYRQRTTRPSIYRYAIGTAIASCLVCAIALILPISTGLLLKLYLIALIHHYTSQSYGLFLLYCHKNRYALSARERSGAASFMHITACVAIARQFSASNATHSFLGERIPQLFVIPDQLILLLTAVWIGSGSMFFIKILARTIRNSSDALPTPCGGIVVTTAAAFLLPGQAGDVLNIFLPAFFHATQYLLLTATQHLRDAHNLERKTNNSLQLQEYLGPLLIGAAVLYVLIPRLISLTGVRYESAFLAVLLAASFHHFLLDRVLWKRSGK